LEKILWCRGLDPRVALRVFQRSFSTKAGQGRGLGTFSMKLFGENYLGGRVSFTSLQEAGTTFSLERPAPARWRGALAPIAATAGC